MFEVHYTPRMVAPAQKYSPSAHKPAEVVESWLRLLPTLKIIEPIPVDTNELALAHDLDWPSLQAAPQATLADRAELQRRLEAVVAGGGDGLMLHRADAAYRPGRNAALLKLKPLHDAEAVVVGHVAGRGKHLGRMGALRLRTDEGADFLVGTGFSDAEREDPPPLGSVVTFSHRGSTAAGVPRFASYLRVREI